MPSSSRCGRASRASRGGSRAFKRDRGASVVPGKGSTMFVWVVGGSERWFVSARFILSAEELGDEAFLIAVEAAYVR